MKRKRGTRPSVCAHCGEPFAARLDSAGKFCSVACSNRSKAGSNHHLYRPDRLSFDRHSGRWKIMLPGGEQKWLARHIVEEHLGRELRAAEVVHHVNDDPTDNRLENLRVVTRSEHMALHRADLEAAKR